MLLGLALLGATVLAGCGEDSAPDEITVLAAASLTETFTDLADEFERQNPGVSIDLAFDSSATLANQVLEGAPADVLGTADLATMQDAVDGGALAEDPQTFAGNEMTMVVPAGNPAGLTSFADLDDGIDYVVCVETAPCGSVAKTLLDRAGVTADPASLETDVKATLAKVAQDEADAGLVYLTDATAAGDRVEVIDIPGAADDVLEYPIGVLAQADAPGLADAFVDLVLSAEGQSILAEAGFGPP